MVSGTVFAPIKSLFHAAVLPGLLHHCPEAVVFLLLQHEDSQKGFNKKTIYVQQNHHLRFSNAGRADLGGTWLTPSCAVHQINQMLVDRGPNWLFHQSSKRRMLDVNM